MMIDRGKNLACLIIFLLFCLTSINSYGIQSTSGASGYALLPTISSLKKGEVLFSTWGSYITSHEFKGTGIFPLNFATGISKHGEVFLTFSGLSGLSEFDRGMTAGLKLNIYKSNNIYPSAGVLIESYSMETSPDARISLILEKDLPWKFNLIFTGGYVSGGRDRRGASGGAGFVYGNHPLRVVFGAKSLNNWNVNSLFLSGIFHIIDRLFLSIIIGHTFSDRKSDFITAGFTYGILKEDERVVIPGEPVPPVEVIKQPEKITFPSTVPKFRLKLK